MKEKDKINIPRRLSIDFGKTIGPVKPVHSTGQGPLLQRGEAPDFSMFRHLKEAGVPYARLHDVGGMFGGNLWVDIPNIFRDFDADENDPASYDFTFTDLYLAALVENGVEPYFRLGVTIENYARSVGKAYRIFPPKDFKKWARVCEHVIRHYTEGWANGCRYKITYWEIWNEADDRPDDRNPMWLGTWRQFCEFYEVAAKHLKAKFPRLKIGGYGRCTAHHVTFEMSGEPVPEEEAYRERCFESFCDFIKERRPPLDFFSFHGYINPDLVAPHTDYHRRMLRKAGYGNVEIHLNEWLCGDRSGYFWRRASLSSVIAAFIAACQHAKNLKIANIYDAKCALSAYAPLFDPILKKPGKAFYALKYFNALYRLGKAVKCEVDGGQGADGLWCVAARGGASRPGEPLRAESPRSQRGGGLQTAGCDWRSGDRHPSLSQSGSPRAAAFIVNDSPTPCQIDADFGGRKPAACRIVDAKRTDAEIPFPATLPPHSFLLVEFA